MGKPVVASRIGGLVDIVRDGETGLLVTAGDPVALQDAIDALLDDNERRASMSIMAQQRIAEFQARAVVSRIEHTYQEVIARYNGDRLPYPGSHGVASPYKIESR